MEFIHNAHVTPVNKDYQSCERTDAALWIYPGTLEHGHITDRLGLQPTEAENKGQVLKNSYGRVRVIPITNWVLSSEPHVQSLDLRHHLDWLTEQLQPCKDELLAMQHIPGMRMTVNCVWWSVMGHSGPVLWPEQMAALAEFNLECAFDVYFFGETL